MEENNRLVGQRGEPGIDPPDKIDDPSLQLVLFRSRERDLNEYDLQRGEYEFDLLIKKSDLSLHLRMRFKESFECTNFVPDTLQRK